MAVRQPRGAGAAAVGSSPWPPARMRPLCFYRPTCPTGRDAWLYGSPEVLGAEKPQPSAAERQAATEARVQVCAAGWGRGLAAGQAATGARFAVAAERARRWQSAKPLSLSRDVRHVRRPGGRSSCMNTWGRMCAGCGRRVSGGHPCTQSSASGHGRRPRKHVYRSSECHPF